jgi:hypothetical protein
MTDFITTSNQNAGKKKNLSTFGGKKISQWMKDAHYGKSSFDVLAVGDSNTMFLDAVGDNVNGFIDGLEEGFNTLGIPTYGSPIYFCGRILTPAGGGSSYSKYFQTLCSGDFSDGIDGGGGGEARLELGQIDADTDYSTFRADLTGPTNDKYSISLSSGAYPNNPPNGTRVDEDFVKIEAGTYPSPGNVFGSLAVRADGSWPLIKNKITARYLYTRHPNNDTAYEHFYIFETGGAARENSAFSSPVNLSGVAGYAAHERSIPASTGATPSEVKVAMTGTGLGFGTFSGKAGFVFFSMHTNTIGVCVSSLYARGGATSTDYKNNLTALYDHNNNKKLKIYFKEVVDRQISANPKNVGRVAIFIQGGRNVTGSGTAADALTYISDIKECIRLYTETWKSLGYSTNNLCFVVCFSPVYTENAVFDEACKTLLNGIESRRGLAADVCIIDHARNLPYADYVANTLWNVTNSSSGSSTPDPHLKDAGYQTLGKRIVSNLALLWSKLKKK